MQATEYKYFCEDYKGFIIQKRIDIKKNTCIVFKDGVMAKCIAGDIRADGTENSIQKAKDWINLQCVFKKV